jgi:hypothetical protein
MAVRGRPGDWTANEDTRKPGLPEPRKINRSGIDLISRRESPYPGYSSFYLGIPEGIKLIF